MYNPEIRNVLISLPLAEELGLDVAIVYSVLQDFNRTDTNKEEGFFSATVDDLTIFTALGRLRLQKAIEVLEREGLIVTEIRGMPRRTHYKLLQEDSNLQHLDYLLKEGEKKLEEAIQKRIDRISEYYK